MVPQTRSSETCSRRAQGPRRKWAIGFGLLLLAGCGQAKVIDETYGRQRGTAGKASVSGTAVFAGMFEAAGHRVVTASRLSPKLEPMDVIVWAPDDFRPPSEEVFTYLDNWLDAAPERTLIYIGRDFDAASTYWEEILPTAPPDQVLEITSRLAMRQSDYDTAREMIPTEFDGPWFSLGRDGPPRQVFTLRGPLSAEIDASQSRIELRGRFCLPRSPDEDNLQTGSLGLAEAEPLLESEAGLLVGRVCRPNWDGSQVMVIANGSFLLNLPLVNHQHRKLAGRLIGLCGRAGQRVVFLESGPGGVRISDRELEVHHVVRAFTQWPINCILMHLTMLGIVYCIFAFPIFGRPRELASDSPSDFGKHIDALGGLLKRTGDRAYAQARLTHYQQPVRRDLGTTLLKPPEPDPTVSSQEARQTTDSKATEEPSAGEPT